MLRELAGRLNLREMSYRMKSRAPPLKRKQHTSKYPLMFVDKYILYILCSQ